MNDKTLGIPFYRAGTGGGTLNFDNGSRVLGISVFANGGEGTMTINGGDTITIRGGSGFGTQFYGSWVNPVIVMSGTLDYFVEGVK